MDEFEWPRYKFNWQYELERAFRRADLFGRFTDKDLSVLARVANEAILNVQNRNCNVTCEYYPYVLDSDDKAGLVDSTITSTCFLEAGHGGPHRANRLPQVPEKVFDKMVKYFAEYYRGT